MERHNPSRVNQPESNRAGSLTNWQSNYAHFPDETEDAAVARVVEQGLQPTQQNVSVMREQIRRNAAPDASPRPVAPAIRLNNDPTQYNDDRPTVTGDEQDDGASWWQWLLGPGAAVAAPAATGGAAAGGGAPVPRNVSDSGGQFSPRPGGTDVAPYDDGTRVVDVNPARSDNALPPPGNTAVLDQDPATRPIGTDEVMPGNQVIDQRGVVELSEAEAHAAQQSGQLVEAGRTPDGSGVVYKDTTTGRPLVQLGDNRWISTDGTTEGIAGLREVLRTIGRAF